MILFLNNNTKYRQTKKIKILKIKRMWVIIEDFIQILRTRTKMNSSAQKNNVLVCEYIMTSTRRLRKWVLPMMN